MSAGGFARRLLSAMDTADPNRAKVEIIVKEVGRIEAILRMILNYLQPMELHMSPTDPNKLVQRALSGMAIEIKNRNVRVDLQLDLGVPEISADGRQMKRVVEVLVKNALNQMPKAATLCVSTSRENDMFNLVMRYPVCCMSVDDVENFFYPFTTFRIVHDTVYDTVDLPMSKTIVEKHGGIINVGIKKSHELIIHISLPA